MTEEKYNQIKVKIISHTEDSTLIDMDDQFLYFMED